MRLDDPAAERESYAGAVRLGGEERLENAIHTLGRKPMPESPTETTLVTLTTEATI